MALVIPTSYSTYGDATSVPGGPLSPYVLAQLPGESQLGWVQELRSLSAVDELKWKVFQTRREAIQAKGDLWKQILASMKTATIVIIKPQDIADGVQAWLDKERAEVHVDYKRLDIIEYCSVSLIAETPVAYLPNRISQSLNLYPQELFLSFEKFVPQNILRDIGGGLRDAKVFAARAHAMFDPRNMPSRFASTADAFYGYERAPILHELVSTQRTFDVEHAKSVKVLNDAADTITGALGEALMLPGEMSDQPLVREFTSHDVDHLQAADIAAGWAHELIALGDERALLAKFGRVLVNGRLLV